MDFVTISRKIQEVIDAPRRKISVEEAQEILRYCGIVDENGNITPKFQGIVIDKRR